MARMVESIEGLADFIIDIPVAWSKLISEQMKDGEIDLIGSVSESYHVRLISYD